jgi:DNA-binding GntR family transcriptional regulator
MLPRIDAAPIQDRVTELLRSRILSGELPGGTRLSVASLAEQLGVSRQPVASALHRLAQEGYVLIRPRSGTVVTDLDAGYFLQALELRLTLEEFAAPLCVARATDEEISTLERLVQQVDQSYPTWESVLAHAAERQRQLRDFHEQLIALSGHQPLIATYRFVYQQCHRVGGTMSAARLRTRAMAAKRRRGPVAEEHHAMLAALRRRDVEALRSAFHKEVERVRAETAQPTQ